MKTVLFLSGTTRGATLEGIGRSLASAFKSVGIELIEISLADGAGLLQKIKSVEFSEVNFIFSFVSMGMDLLLTREDGSHFNIWQELGIPFLSVHGDSPAYFFDRHVVKSSNFVTIYGFDEHRQLRERLPRIHGMIVTLWPIVLDDIPLAELDLKAKKDGPLIFLKNGKDPVQIRARWASWLTGLPLRAIMDLACELERDLDNPASNQIDDLVTSYFADAGFDVEHLIKLRLFFIAQLDDFLRAAKATRIAQGLMDFPVEIRGNEWNHLDFSGKRAKYIDECDYVKSIGLIRSSLGIIDMSPNTTSRPHDRIMRAYGAHTCCLTNTQQFLEVLPHQDRLSFTFEKGSLQDKVAYLLDHKDAALEMGLAVAEAYRRNHPPEELALKMLDCAALARLNNLAQRPALSQDFFVWPPKSL